jgi:hypothetical protein
MVCHFKGMFEDRVPSRIFGPKRDEVRGDWRITQQRALCCVVCLFPWASAASHECTAAC